MIKIFKEKFNFITQFSFVRFCLVGGFLFCFDAILLYLLIYRLYFSASMARLGSATCSITISWILHRIYTFGPSRSRPLLEYKNYIICSLISFVINLSTYIILIKKLLIFEQFPILALVVATATSMNFSYFCMKKIVFLKQ